MIVYIWFTLVAGILAALVMPGLFVCYLLWFAFAMFAITALGFVCIVVWFGCLLYVCLVV